MNEVAPHPLTLLFGDIVGSVDLKRTLGEVKAAHMIERVGAIFSECCQATSGDYLDNAGDGYFATFTAPSAAVHCGLLFLWRLEREPWEHGPVQVRVAAHVGEIKVQVLDHSRNQRKPSGLAVDIAARVMNLDVPGRFFLTYETSAIARGHGSLRTESDGPLGIGEIAKWEPFNHGYYGFKGGFVPGSESADGGALLIPPEEPLQICEAVMAGRQPLRPSPTSEKCWPVDRLWNRLTKPEDPVPEIREGQLVPGNTGGAWVIERSLGRGGFGEAWLAEDRDRPGEYRVFKFPNDPQRVRSFFREEKLARILDREISGLNDQKGIVKVLGMSRESPMWIATDFYPHGSLVDWVQENPEAFAALPRPERIRFIIELARIVQRAHEVGVIHKDIKPSNIFIRMDVDGTIHPVLADFGIGCIVRQELLDKHGPQHSGNSGLITVIGSSRTGTSIYSPQEYLKPDATPTAKGDVFALGKVLYQFIIGDLTEPAYSARECRRRVSDEFLFQVIDKAVEVESARFESAEELARKLECLEEDRAASREAELREQLARQTKLREEADHLASLAKEAETNAKLAQSEAERRSRLFRWAAVLVGCLMLIAVALAVTAKQSQLKEAEQKQLAVKAQEAAERNRQRASSTIDQMGTRLIEMKEETWSDTRSNMAADIDQFEEDQPDDWSHPEWMLERAIRLKLRAYVASNVLTGSDGGTVESGRRTKALNLRLRALEILRKLCASKPSDDRCAQEYAEELLLLATNDGFDESALFDLDSDGKDRAMRLGLLDPMPGPLRYADALSIFSTRCIQEGLRLVRSRRGVSLGPLLDPCSWRVWEGYFGGLRASQMLTTGTVEIDLGGVTAFFGERRPGSPVFAGIDMTNRSLAWLNLQLPADWRFNHDSPDCLLISAANCFLESPKATRWDYWSDLNQAAKDKGLSPFEQRVFARSLLVKCKVSYRVFQQLRKRGLTDRNALLRFAADSLANAMALNPSDPKKGQGLFSQSLDMAASVAAEFPHDMAAHEAELEIAHQALHAQQDPAEAAKFKERMVGAARRLESLVPGRLFHWLSLEAKAESDLARVYANFDPVRAVSLFNGAIAQRRKLIDAFPNHASEMYEAIVISQYERTLWHVAHQEFFDGAALDETVRDMLATTAKWLTLDGSHDNITAQTFHAWAAASSAAQEADHQDPDWPKLRTTLLANTQTLEHLKNKTIQREKSSETTQCLQAQLEALVVSYETLARIPVTQATPTDGATSPLDYLRMYHAAGKELWKTQGVQHNFFGCEMRLRSSVLLARILMAAGLRDEGDAVMKDVMLLIREDLKHDAALNPSISRLVFGACKLWSDYSIDNFTSHHSIPSSHQALFTLQAGISAVSSLQNVGTWNPEEVYRFLPNLGFLASALLTPGALTEGDFEGAHPRLLGQAIVGAYAQVDDMLGRTVSWRKISGQSASRETLLRVNEAWAFSRFALALVLLKLNRHAEGLLIDDTIVGGTYDSSMPPDQLNQLKVLSRFHIAWDMAEIEGGPVAFEKWRAAWLGYSGRDGVDSGLAKAIGGPLEASAAVFAAFDSRKHYTEAHAVAEAVLDWLDGLIKRSTENERRSFNEIKAEWQARIADYTPSISAAAGGSAPLAYAKRASKPAFPKTDKLITNAEEPPGVKLQGGDSASMTIPSIPTTRGPSYEEIIAGLKKGGLAEKALSLTPPVEIVDVDEPPPAASVANPATKTAPARSGADGDPEWTVVNYASWNNIKAAEAAASKAIDEYDRDKSDSKRSALEKALTNVVDWCFTTSQHSAAEAWSRKLLALNPNNVNALVKLTSAMVFGGRPDQALNELERLAQNPATLLPVAERTLDFYSEMRKRGGVWAGQSKVVRFIFDKAGAAISEARTAKLTAAEARQASENSINSQSALAGEETSVSDKAMYQRDWAGCEAHARRAIELDPSESGAYGNLANALLFQGRYAEARRIYRSHWQDSFNGWTLGGAILEDFDRLAAVGITHPDVERVKAEMANLNKPTDNTTSGKTPPQKP